MKNNKTFEEASRRLEEILQQLSDEDTPLDQSLKLYAEAAELISFCSDILRKAQITVEEIDASLTASRRGEDNDV